MGDEGDHRMTWDIPGAVTALSGLISKLIPDRAAAAAATAQLQQMAMQGQLTEELAQLQALTSAQTDINKIEAASSSMFVAGWRPFIGWVCGAAFGVQFLVAPLATWIAGLCGHPVTFPQLDAATLMPLTLGMLGMGGMRTFEKFKGVQGNH